MAKKDYWQHNASTGTYRHKVTREGHIRTDGSNWDGMLYRAEYWGDSSCFPIYGSWRKSLDAARRELLRMRKEEEC